MPTLIPTKETGAAARPNPLVYVEPDRAVRDDAMKDSFAGTGMNGSYLADLLSSMLAHERCGTHLYRSVAARTNNGMLKARYTEFGKQTARHVTVLEGLIERAGGNPSYVSPAARATEGMDAKLLEATFLLEGGLDVMTREAALLDAVLVAEAVDHANWSGLAHLAEAMDEGELRTAFVQAVAEVEAEEDEHYGWAQETKLRMTTLRAEGSMLAAVGAKTEELVARVRDWFT